jgi:hypothetical protein
MPFSTVERRTDAIVLGLALLSIGSSFLLPLPPGFQELNRSYWPRLAQILITCLLFILLFVVRSHHKSPHWRLMAVAAVLGGLVSLLSFLYFSAAFTCQYYDQSKIIGSTLTPMGSDYLTRYPSATCEDLLKAFTGHQEEIWSASSLWVAELAVGSTYALIGPLLAMAIASVVRGTRPARMPLPVSDNTIESVFISYASEDRKFAEDIQLALCGAGYRVFFDKESLPAGGDYHSRIRQWVEDSDILVFLISPDSVKSGGYALTELKYAREKWAHPGGRVLPVVVRSTEFESIPKYLRAVTLLEPEGNVAAETVGAVTRMREQ